jgi:hypothetical protein
MRPPLQFRPRPVDCEWLGGRYPVPNQSKAAEVDIWLELPRGVIVAITLIDSGEPIPFGASLQQTMTRPSEGSPRRPARIRVADERLAREVREAAGNDVSVVVAPVPELDAAFDELIEKFTENDPRPESYLGDGVEPEVVASLFSAAGAFFRAAPWKHVDETQVLQADIPVLGLSEACLCIIGGAGESFGLLLFRSFAGYRATEAPMLSLSFSRKKEIPPAMLEEIARHGWRVAGPKAYPHVMAIDAGELQPMTDRDLRILTACAGAFLAFFTMHRALFAADDPRVVCESLVGDDGVIVTLTLRPGITDITESFSFDARMRAEIESRLTAMDEIENERRTKRESTYLFLRLDGSVLGRIFVNRDTLRIETASENNAQWARRRIREVCGSILNGNTNDDLIRQAKEAHYRKWLDKPLPILGGKTPRAAARSAKSRKDLEEVLRLIEDIESGQPKDERFDFGSLRRELGFEE